MTFDAIAAWWWPYLFILLAGVVPNNIWRVLGVFVGSRLDDGSAVLVLARTVATGLVAGVIGNLIVHPAGALAATPVALRLAAVAAAMIAWHLAGRRLLLAIAVAEAVIAFGLVAF